MIDRLVAKLYRGECTEEELETLFDLLKERDSSVSDSLMRKIWQESEQFNTSDHDTKERVLAGIQAKLEMSSKSTTMGTEQPVQTKHIPLNWKLSAAAAVAVILTAFFLWPSAISSKVVQTQFGEQRSIQFEDGSQLRLNANSKITYLSDRSWQQGKPRTIWLEGEAYFEVEKKPMTNQTFEVRTDHALVEVLGTAFNVHTSSEGMRVYLDHGSIRLHLSAMDTVILMHPGDLVTYQEKDRSFSIKKQVAKALHTSWKDGVLTFNDSQLGEVIDKIEQIYGVRFRVANEANYNRKIEFPMPIDSLNTAISILNRTLSDLEIVQEGEVFIIQ